MKNIMTVLLAALLLLVPQFAFAAFYDSASQAQQQVDSLTQQQLDSLNNRVFSDAFIIAKIIGFDRSEIDQLKADVRTLKEENARLRAQLALPVSLPVGAPSLSANDSRIADLEAKFESLHETLANVVALLTVVLRKLQ